MQNTKVWGRDEVVALLMRDDPVGKRAVTRALELLYKRQTATEQATLSTSERNGRGFNSRDAEFLSDIARKLPRYNGNMTRRQWMAVRDRLVKYWRQILEEIPVEKRAAPVPTVEDDEAVMRAIEVAGDRAEMRRDAEAIWGMF